MISIVENIEQFDLICSDKSLSLFDHAIGKNKLPSRLYHVLIAICALLLEPFSIWRPIANVYGNLDLLAHKQERKMIVYAAFRLILDFSSIFATAITAVIRISLSIFGIISPVFVAKSWRMAEKIDNWFLKLKADLWDQLAPNIPFFGNQQLGIKSLAIRPVYALKWFGEDRCLELEKASKSMEQITQFEKELKKEFNDFLIFINEQNPSKLERALKNEPEKLIIVKDIFSKLALEKNDDLQSIIKKINEKLSPKEIQILYNHINDSVVTGHQYGSQGKANAYNFFSNKCGIDSVAYTKRTHKIEHYIGLNSFGSISLFQTSFSITLPMYQEDDLDQD